MRAFTSVDIVKLLVVFSLFLVFGCAQNAYSVKEVVPDANETATLLAISVSGEASTSRVEVLADKPLTYTYYSLKEPYRTVIDLSQAEPGTVKAPLLDGSSIIKKIDIEKNELASGSLVRITIETDVETEFATVADSTDKSKLVFSVVSAQKSEPSKQAVSTQSSVYDQKEETKNLSTVVLPEKEVETLTSAPNAVSNAVPSSNSSTNANEPKYQSEPALASTTTYMRATNEGQSSNLTVTSLDVVQDCIVIQAGGPIEKYRFFTLTKPQRLAVDIFNVKSGFSSKTVAINTLGIASARLGIYPDKIRIVFDSTRTTFPAFELKKTESGLKLVLGERESVSTTNAPQDKPYKVISSVPKMHSEPKETSRVDAIDFKIVEGYSRISVTMSGDCVLEGPAKTENGLVLTFAKCSLPKRLQRPFDTSAFASVVKMLTPYQTKVGGRQGAKILITLRQNAPFTLKREGEIVKLDIKNPEIPQTPLLVSGKVTSPALSTGSRVAESRLINTPERGKYQTVSTEKRPDKKVYTGKRVTLEFADADIRKIFQLIAEVSNYNILVGDDVTGTISIKLVNVPWDQALM